jgi:hypothetical protein
MRLNRRESNLSQFKNSELMKLSEEDLERHLSMMGTQERRSYLAYLDFKEGMIITEISKKHKIHPNSFYSWFKKFMTAEASKFKAILNGNKNTPYYDNEDDYSADRVYNWEDLSDKEKSFYEKYENKNKRQYT